MTITCSHLDDLLFDGSPLAMETAARHASQCAACAGALAAWIEISDTARSMQGAPANDLLWPRIERALRQSKRGPSVSRLSQVAAAIFLTLALGSTLFYALRVQIRDAAFDRHILRISALEEVEKAEDAHKRAIANLERVADPKLANASSPLTVSYKEKLMLLDDAIAECQANIERNRQNAHLREQLLAMYSEKQRTLEDVLREENHVSNP